jgi:hypothetical protein
MQEFHGNLSLGGLQLQHLHGELEADQPLPDSKEHLLTGRISVPPAQKEQLEFGRRYRLEIEDGPAGPVVVSRIEAEKPDEIVVEFQPPPNGKPR